MQYMNPDLMIFVGVRIDAVRVDRHARSVCEDAFGYLFDNDDYCL